MHVRRTLLVLIVISGLFCSLISRAENAPKAVSGGPKSAVRIGADLHYFSYEESGVMEESGFLYGFSGAFEHLTAYNLLFDISASIVAGELAYDGMVVYKDGSEAPLIVDTPNTIFNLKGTGGIVIEYGGLSIVPYSGIGYRFLVDDLEAASSVYGYTREQTYVYLPIGVGVYRRLQSSWLFDCRLEYKIMLDSRNRSHGGGLGGSVVLPQNSASGFSGSVGLTHPGNGDTAFRLESFLEIWNVDDSEIVDGYMEPENESFLLGARFTVCFF